VATVYYTVPTFMLIAQALRALTDKQTKKTNKEKVKVVPDITDNNYHT